MAPNSNIRVPLSMLRITSEKNPFILTISISLKVLVNSNNTMNNNTNNMSITMVLP